MNLLVRNRKTGTLEKEMVFGKSAIHLLYNKNLLSPLLLALCCKNALFSKIVGFYQKLPFTKKNIQPFIEKYDIDAEEFDKKIEEFTSFNDFFIRKLKKRCRPIDPDPKSIIIPADGRYLTIPNISASDGFLVKGETFSLRSLLQNEMLAKRYENGAMILARLCPVDYHRFHFPLECSVSSETLINGPLYSVNPLALKQNCRIFTENKRSFSLLKTKTCGDVLFMEVGATCVGTIIQTFSSSHEQKKGDEKGYFSFGGSSLILLFEPGKIRLSPDLAATSCDKIELRCLMGEPLGWIN